METLLIKIKMTLSWLMLKTSSVVQSRQKRKQTSTIWQYYDKLRVHVDKRSRHKCKVVVKYIFLVLNMEIVIWDVVLGRVLREGLVVLDKCFYLKTKMVWMWCLKSLILNVLRSCWLLWLFYMIYHLHVICWIWCF